MLSMVTVMMVTVVLISVTSLVLSMFLQSNNGSKAQSSKYKSSKVIGESDHLSDNEEAKIVGKENNNDLYTTRISSEV